jgi:hypothetical protein
MPKLGFEITVPDDELEKALESDEIYLDLTYRLETIIKERVVKAGGWESTEAYRRMKHRVDMAKERLDKCIEQFEKKKAWHLDRKKSYTRVLKLREGRKMVIAQRLQAQILKRKDAPQKYREKGTT